MSKKPVALIFFVALFILTMIQYRLDVRSAHLKGFEILLKDKERNLSMLSSVAHTVFNSNPAVPTLEGHLKDAIRLQWIDFYIVTFNGEVVANASARELSNEAMETLVPEHPPDAFWQFQSKHETKSSLRTIASLGRPERIEDFSFLETELRDGWRLKLGFNIDREAFLAAVEEKTKDENRRILVLGLILTFAVFLFSARDILRVAKAIRSKGLGSLRDLKPMSAEADALKRGIEGFEEAVQRLEGENQLLGAQVLPSLQSELHSGKKPPYDFLCTMVRTDINNFTSIFHSHSQAEFLATINRFFIGCSHAISRYNGLIHEFVGDEIIFYFKDERHSNSFTAALACVEEINKLAEMIHLETVSNRGYSFRVKSSVSHGTIRFGPLLNGFSLAGAPLIETSRILSHVSEKDENTVHFDRIYEGLLHEAIETKIAFRAHLKGISGEREILRLTGRRQFADVLEESPLLQKAAGDYRSDQDLLLLLNAVANLPERDSTSLLLRSLSNYRLTDASDELVARLAVVIDRLAKVQKADRFEIETNRVLATLVMAAPRLTSTAKQMAEIQPLMVKLLDHADHRVAANALEALHDMHARDEVVRESARKLIASNDNRVSANALVYFGSQVIDRTVLSHLDSALMGRDLAAAASAVYAIGEIAKNQLAADPVYYRTQTEFLQLLPKVADLARRNKSLRPIAEQSLAKAGESRLLSAASSAA